MALGAVLLLPFSIISNEVLLSFPHNYYIQWLNGSLIHGGCTGWSWGAELPPSCTGTSPHSAPLAPPTPPGLWNLVFLFSNLSLVFLMPFAYFFTESEGFAGSKKVCSPMGAVPLPVPPHAPPTPPGSVLILDLQGIMARVYETSVVLLLLTLLVLGMVWVASAITGNDAVSRQSLYGGCWGGGGRGVGIGAALG